MSTKKQKSVLTADNAGKAVTAPVVTAATRFDSKGFLSDNWDYADDEVVMDVHGKYITFGELKKRKAEGYYDDWEADEPKAQTAAAAKKEQQEKADNEAYRKIVREAYQDYRRNLSLFPEMEVLMSSGDTKNLLTQNDVIFQEQVKQEAARRDKKTKKLVRQVDALVQPKPEL